MGILNFFKKSFKDMKESAKSQHEVDKANFNAVKAESRANFEENRGRNTFAKAKADAIRQMGLAESEAIREKSKALAQNANLVELTKAERWNGQLPQNIYGSGPVPFLDISAK